LCFFIVDFNHKFKSLDLNCINPDLFLYNITGSGSLPTHSVYMYIRVWMHNVQFSSHHIVAGVLLCSGTQQVKRGFVQ